MRCPACRAENDQGPQCRRCRADLAVLFLLEEKRRHALAEGYRSAARGHWARAQAIALGADTLRRDPESLRLVAVSSLVQGQFAQAWQCYLAHRAEAG